jgi:peptide/nickel transport system permease protein
MGGFILRRLIQAVFTVFGVMLVTFVLFNVIAGDISAPYVSQRATKEDRERWLAKRGLDKPLFLNPDAGARFWTGEFYDTQFAHHMRNCVTFEARSYRFETKTVLDIIREKGKYSLSITVPVMALGWLLALSIASVVAFYRGRLIDRAGVFLTVLGMCVPYLAYIILGQWLMFRLSPAHAFGVTNPYNVYVPIAIAAVAGLGGSVRFYRTVILDEINRDYVRTARAKGVPLVTILSKHVMKNCMLPILTSLIMSIPFLIFGSFLLEQFFGINGLGGLMISSIADRDIPVITGVTFLTAIAYVVALLITDILYAVFDPRIRLR